MKQRISYLISALLLTLTAVEAAQAADAGSVVFASGSVTAERTPAVALAKGDSVLAEDIVVTGEASRAQLLMIDGAKIAIRPNSRLRIDEFEYAAATTGTSAVTTTDDSSVMSLVKGGFRTITGAIGKKDPADYEVRTAVGVLGIRGTNFAVLLCGGDCEFAPGVAAGAPVEDGLYLGVYEGAIVFRNEIATIELKAGEFAFIPMNSRTPELLDAPPAVLLDDNDLRFDGEPGASRPQTDDSTQEGTTAGFDSKLGTRRAPETSTFKTQSSDAENGESPEPPSQQVIGIDADGTPVDLTPGGGDPTNNRPISYSTGPLGAFDPTYSSALVNTAQQYQLDNRNNLTGFTGDYPGGNVDEPAAFGIGGATNVETGFDSMTVLRWGRWAGGTAAITLADGTDVSQDLRAQSIHWISGPEAAAPVMPISGVANYTLVGATSPTDNVGNVGVLGAASFSADFTNMTVDSMLSIDINGSNWFATGSGGIGDAADPIVPTHLFNGFYNAVAIDGIAGGGGVFSGFFSEPGPSSDPSIPGGVGLTYSLQDQGGSTSVSGAAAFGNP